MKVITIVLVAAVVVLLGGCGQQSQADRQASLVDRLLEDDAVLAVFPDLEPRSGYSTGESYGRISPRELQGGPVAEATRGVVRQWSREYSRLQDEPIVPMPIHVASMVYQFEAPSDARAAVDGLLDSVRQEHAAVVPHERLDAVVTPPDESHLVTAIGAIADRDRVTAVQIAAVERIDPDALDALLDATAAQLDPS